MKNEKIAVATKNNKNKIKENKAKETTRRQKSTILEYQTTINNSRDVRKPAPPPLIY